MAEVDLDPSQCEQLVDLLRILYQATTDDPGSPGQVR
jgi:hypothetical protein